MKRAPAIAAATCVCLLGLGAIYTLFPSARSEQPDASAPEASAPGASVEPSRSPLRPGAAPSGAPPRAPTPTRQRIAPAPLSTTPFPVAGQVVDDRGQPVPGAEIALASNGVPIARALSDEGGRFALAAPNAEIVELRLRAAGHSPKRELAKPGRPMKVVLERDVDVRGHVLLPSGERAAAGVEVVILDRHGGVVGDSVLTQADGAFRITAPGDTPSWCVLTARAPGLVCLEAWPLLGSSRHSRDRVLRLHAGTGGEVWVVHEGTPVEDAEVALNSEVAGARLTHQAVFTDARGHARLRALPLGRHRVDVKARGLAKTQVFYELSPGGPAPVLRVELVAGGSLRGRLLTAEDAPVPDADLFVGSLSVEDGENATTDERGAFGLESLNAGVHEVWELNEVAPVLLGRVTIRPGQSVDVTLRRPALSSVVRGRVLRDGKGMAEVVVGLLSPRSTSPWTIAETDAEGNFSMRVTPGSYFAFTSGAPQQRLEAKAQQEHVVQLEVSTAVVAGRVVGGVEGDTKVVLLRLGWGFEVERDALTRPNEAGAFAFADVPAGRYRVIARGPRGVALSDPFTLEEGQSRRDLALQLTTGATLSLEVGGAGDAAATVSYYRVDEGALSSDLHAHEAVELSVPQEQGAGTEPRRLDLPRLPPGRYVVFVATPAGDLAVARAALVEGKTTRLAPRLQRPASVIVVAPPGSQIQAYCAGSRVLAQPSVDSFDATLGGNRPPDADGSYRLQSLPATEVEVVVKTPDGKTLRWKGTLEPGATRRVEPR